MTNAVVKTRPDYRVEVFVDACGYLARIMGVHEAKLYGVESPS